MSNRLDRLHTRRIDADITEAKLLNEVYRQLGQSDSVKYVIGSMQPIDPEYTKNTFYQGDRVCSQLDKCIDSTCEYKYQGSVTNDTHIKARSDIDILLITKKFITLEEPQVPENPYKGNPIQDLLDLRTEATKCLSSAFPKASVDSSGSKSITIEGGSLTRKIDVVPSNWYNTNEYAESKKDIYRGVYILDSENKERLKNTPFLHNAWIDFKDSSTNGGLRKASRLMKSLKYDTESIDLSSYDLVSIAFNIDDSKLNVSDGLDLLILNSCYEFCSEIQSSQVLRESLEVPDAHRKIFSEGHATLNGLNQLVFALEALINDVLSENQRSFRKLAGARIEY